jgi:hypothetical protein
MAIDAAVSCTVDGTSVGEDFFLKLLDRGGCGLATNRGEFRMWERETGASGAGCRHVCDVAGLSCAAG